MSTQKKEQQFALSVVLCLYEQWATAPKVKNCGDAKRYVLKSSKNVRDHGCLTEGLSVSTVGLYQSIHAN